MKDIYTQRRQALMESLEGPCALCVFCVVGLLTFGCAMAYHLHKTACGRCGLAFLFGTKFPPHFAFCNVQRLRSNVQRLMSFLIPVP